MAVWGIPVRWKSICHNQSLREGRKPLSFSIVSSLPSQRGFKLEHSRLDSQHVMPTLEPEITCGPGCAGKLSAVVWVNPCSTALNLPLHTQLLCDSLYMWHQKCKARPRSRHSGLMKLLQALPNAVCKLNRCQSQMVTLRASVLRAGIQRGRTQSRGACEYGVSKCAGIRSTTPSP